MDNRELAIAYCRDELAVGEQEAERLYRKVSKYQDIYAEFLAWLKKRDFFAIKGPVIIDGYSAQKIHELAPSLTGMGIYNFLVTLRDNPTVAKEIIDSGFAVQ